MVQQLVFTEPRRGRPPRHLADLDEQGASPRSPSWPAGISRQTASAPVLRPADRRSAQMTDLPAAIRDHGCRVDVSQPAHPGPRHHV